MATGGPVTEWLRRVFGLCAHEEILAHSVANYYGGSRGLNTTCTECGRDRTISLGSVFGDDSMREVITVKLEARGYQQEPGNKGRIWRKAS